MTTKDERVYTFSFVDTSDHAEPVIRQCRLQEGAPYTQVISEFFGFLSQVYGYDVAKELGPL